MPQPRRIRPGSTWLVTRRCLEGRRFLRPDGLVTDLLLYILGYAVGLFGLQIHAVAALSNHLHLVVTDPTGKICAFFERANLLIARAVNRFRGRSGAFWEPGRLSLVELVTPEDVLSKLVYVMANPCRHDLVDQATYWPGLLSRPEDISNGTVFKALRPVGFFRSKGIMPDATEFEITRPPGFDHLTDTELLELLREELNAEERKHRNRRRREKRKVVGKRRVLKANWNGSSGSPKPPGDLNPHLACKDPKRRIDELAELKRFRSEYRLARKRFSAGERRALFPYGTYNLRRHLSVRCRGPTTDACPTQPGSSSSTRGADAVATT